MSTAVACLSLSLMMASQAGAESDPWREVYNLSREVSALRLELAELRHAMEQGPQCRCPQGPEPGAFRAPDTVVPKKSEAPADPPQVVTRAEAAPASGKGTIRGRVEWPDRERGQPAYVWIADIRGPPVVGEVAEIRQKGRRFRPDHLVVRAGTRVSFPNDDEIFHHVFSVAPGNIFDLGYARRGSSVPSRLFAVPGVVDVNCNIHPAMRSTVLVLPNRHWARVGSDGSFTLTDVPRGAHVLRAWSPNTNEVEEKIAVSAEGVEGVVLVLKERSRPGTY